MAGKYKGLFVNFDFMAKRRIALYLAVILAVVGVISFIAFKGFNLGTDFSGGLRIEFTAPASVNDLRSTITGTGISITTLRIGDTESFLLTAPANKEGENAVDTYLKPIREKYGEENIVILSSSFVGPSVGYGFSLQAIRLVGIVAFLVLIYVAFRFDYIYAVGAIVASLHDIFVMIVVTLALRIPVDLTVTAAFLTILGYSINDTIVIFDRIRENHALIPEEDMAPVINKSISQCLKRTILTSLTTLFVAVAIYIWAGNALQSFGLLMIVGIISGTYSSLFVAAPITYLIWRSRHTKKIKKAMKV